jgi:hypothetical protein
MRLCCERFCLWTAFVLLIQFLPVVAGSWSLPWICQDACDVAAVDCWSLVGGRAAAPSVHYVLVLHDQGSLGLWERSPVDVLGTHGGGHLRRLRFYFASISFFYLEPYLLTYLALDVSKRRSGRKVLRGQVDRIRHTSTPTPAHAGVGMVSQPWWTISRLFIFWFDIFGVGLFAFGFLNDLVQHLILICLSNIALLLLRAIHILHLVYCRLRRHRLWLWIVVDTSCENSELLLGI